MAAVPPGPDTGSRPEMISFHGNRCCVPGDPENLGGNLQDTTGHPDVCGSKLERGNPREYPFSDLEHRCETLERRINGFSCIGVSGFLHHHHHHHHHHAEDELKTPTEHCDRSSCDQNTSNPEHKLGFPYQDTTQNMGTFSPSPTHAHDLGNKVTKCYLRTDGEPEVTPQTLSDADGPVLEMCRLDLNHSPATEANQSQDAVYVHYESELQMPGIMRLITKDLSEPYSIYTYRYFIHNWPQLCFLVCRQLRL